MSSYTWPSSGGSGGSGVTSVGLVAPSSLFAVTGSPVTTSGDLVLSFVNQTANFVFAGPVSGGANTPQFRALVVADIPNLPASIITSGKGSISTTTTGVTIGSGANSTLGPNVTVDLTLGNLTDVGTDGITITGGTGVVIGAGTSISQRVADATHNGYLSQTDWSTFNGKQAAGSYITALTGDATAAGPGSAALTLATVNSNVGSFTNAAITVNGKGLITAASSGTTGNLTDVGTDGITITGGTGAVLGSGTSIAQHVADSTHNGYLSSTDWSAFDAKGTGTVTSVTFTGDGTVLSSTPSGAVTTTGTLTATLNTQSANTVLAGPTSGGASAPTFRALVRADLPALIAMSGEVQGGGSIPATTWTQISGFTSNYDTSSILNTGTGVATIPANGYYSIIGMNNLVAGAAVTAGARILVNGAVRATSFGAGTTTGLVTALVSRDFQLVATDTVTLEFYNSDAVPHNLDTTNGYPYFTITKYAGN